MFEILTDGLEGNGVLSWAELERQKRREKRVIENE